ncbi:MAG: GAF domain-containing protein [Anaerolineae bacterium]|nr:GAF domain-containing protein [Anaerolineae bacterium]
MSDKLIDVFCIENDSIADNGIVDNAISHNANIECGRAEQALQIQVNQQRAVAQLSQHALVNINLTTLFQEAVTLVARALDVEYCKILEYSAEDNVFLLRAGVGWKPGLIGQARVGIEKDSQAGYTLLINEPVIVYDLRTETRFHGPQLLLDHNIISGISVVIPGVEHPFGILGVHTSHLHEFTPADVRFVQVMANVLAQAIEHVWANKMLTRRNRELEMLNRASQALVSTLNLDEVLATVLEEVRRLLNVVACSIWLIEPTTDELVCRQVVGPAQNDLVLGWRLPLGQGLVGQVALSGQSLIVSDVHTDPRHYRGIVEKTGLDLRSILSIPLKAKNDITGVLQVVDDQAARFRVTDLTLLEPLAATAAMAIENAKLFEQVRRDALAQEMLLHEVNHRVKNNLTSIIGILALELRRTYQDDADFKATLRDLRDRIQGMTIVHNLLSEAHWSPLLLDKLLIEIIRAALNSSPICHKIKVQVNSPEVPLHIIPQQATSLALIINELTINSVKHAFTGRDHGYLQIDISYHPETRRITLHYKDDGPGWPLEVLQGKYQSTGLRLVRMTVRSPLRGKFTLHNENGAIATLTFTHVPAQIGE